MVEQGGYIPTEYLESPQKELIPGTQIDTKELQEKTLELFKDKYDEDSQQILTNHIIKQVETYGTLAEASMKKPLDAETIQLILEYAQNHDTFDQEEFFREVDTKKNKLKNLESLKKEVTMKNKYYKVLLEGQDYFVQSLIDSVQYAKKLKEGDTAAVIDLAKQKGYWKDDETIEVAGPSFQRQYKQQVNDLIKKLRKADTTIHLEEEQDPEDPTEANFTPLEDEQLTINATPLPTELPSQTTELELQQIEKRELAEKVRTEYNNLPWHHKLFNRDLSNKDRATYNSIVSILKFVYPTMKKDALKLYGRVLMRDPNIIYNTNQINKTVNFFPFIQAVNSYAGTIEEFQPMEANTKKIKGLQNRRNIVQGGAKLALGAASIAASSKLSEYIDIPEFSSSQEKEAQNNTPFPQEEVPDVAESFTPLPTQNADAPKKYIASNQIRSDKETNQQESSIQQVAFAVPETIDYDQLGLPNPDYEEGRQSVANLLQRIESNEEARRAVDKFLDAQEHCMYKLSDVFTKHFGENFNPDFPIAWVWFENADYRYTNKEGYPSNYFDNYKDNDKYWKVSMFRKTQKSGDFQVNGAQVFDSINNSELGVKELYRKLYGDNPNAFREHLQKLIDESKGIKGEGIEGWSYVDSPYEGLLEQYLTPDRKLKPDLNLSIDSIAVAPDQFNSDPLSNFITTLVMKDPSVGFALNMNATNRSLLTQFQENRKGKVYGYIGEAEKQVFANRLEALHQYRAKRRKMKEV